MTASERKFLTRDVILITIGVVLILGYVLFYHLVTRRDEGVNVNGAFFNTEMVSTKEDMARGLSGRSGIDPDTAMLFKFEQAGQHCMWMKDMKFAIDMVWLDESHKVVSIERNVSPDTYPQNFCHDGKTVVEFAAGTADRIPLHIGDRVE